jgi:hypothetical protein
MFDIDKHNKQLQTTINVSEREKDFRNLIFDNKEFADNYSTDTLNRFFNYWSEKTKGGGKMRFELQPTWELGKRLASWKKRDDERKLKNSSTYNASDFN